MDDLQGTMPLVLLGRRASVSHQCGDIGLVTPALTVL